MGHELETHSINKTIEDYERSSSFLEKLGANTDTYLQKFFEKWGTYCAGRPWLILFLGACVVVGLGHGIKYLKVRYYCSLTYYGMIIVIFQVTTDPVELWASPASRSRIEKEYFDSHFEPFYRTEQIIIRAVNLSYIYHNTSDGIITFGPAFNDSFLLAVLELQETIKALGANTSHSFDKICFAPMRSESQKTTSTKECVVQSIWGYYKDSVVNFNKTGLDPSNFTTNYLDKFLECAA